MILKYFKYNLLIYDIFCIYFYKLFRSYLIIMFVNIRNHAILILYKNVEEKRLIKIFNLFLTMHDYANS